MIYFIAILVVIVIIASLVRRKTSLHGGGYPKIIYVCEDDIFGTDCPDRSDEDGLVSNMNDSDSESKSETGKSDRDGNNECHIEYATDYYGNTYKSIRSRDHTECCRSCLADTGCKSWTYDSDENICRLKSTPPSNITSCTRRISGSPNRESETGSTVKSKNTNRQVSVIKTDSRRDSTPSLSDSRGNGEGYSKSNSLASQSRVPLTLYSDLNYKGQQLELNEGEYDLVELNFGNKTSSLKLASGYRATLYNKRDLSGENLSFTVDSNNIGSKGVASVLIEKVDGLTSANFYSNIGYEGKMTSLPVGRFTVNDLRLPDNIVSSIRVSPSYRVVFQNGDKQVVAIGDVQNLDSLGLSRNPDTIITVEKEQPKIQQSAPKIPKIAF